MPLEESPSVAPKPAMGETAPWNFCEEDVFFRNRMPKTTHWSIPWSDLMMTMFILFALLYIYQHPGRDVVSDKETIPPTGIHFEAGADVIAGEFGELVPTVNEPISRIYDLSKEMLRANDLEDFATVDLIPDKAVRIMLASDLLFDTGEANLKPEAKRSLERIARIIQQTSYMVNVVGHTDNTPIHSERFPTNWELSAIRACEVAKFLIEEMGTTGKRFYISGHSYHQPVSSNNVPGSRAANRRVEIIITKERPYGSPGHIEEVSDSDARERTRRVTIDSWSWDAL